MSKTHWLTAIDTDHLLARFLRDSLDQAITYGGIVSSDNLNQLQLKADADFSKHPDRRKSRSCFVVFFNDILFVGNLL